MNACHNTYHDDFAVQCEGLYCSLLRSLRNLLRVQLLKADIRRERRRLARLDPSRLDDMGISRENARIEAARHDLPAARLARLCLQDRG